MTSRADSGRNTVHRKDGSWSPDVNEGVSTEGHWKQVTMDEDIPF